MLCPWVSVAQTTLPASPITPVCSYPHSLRSQLRHCLCREQQDTMGAELQCRLAGAEACDHAVSISGISLQESSAFLADWGGVSRAQ